MLQAQQSANYNSINGKGNNNGFSAHPRVVAQKSKYKDPYGATDTEEYVPQNLMHDKRIFRGSTNAAMVIPSGTYPDQLFQANKRKYNPKQLDQQRARAAEEFFTRDVKTPEAPVGKQNIDIQTDQFVSELTDKAPTYEIATNTEFIIEKERTAYNVEVTRGVNKKTLVEDNELFLFDDEVEPILSVLCGKTLEVARMEVLEEEELAEMKRQQALHAEFNKNEKEEIQKMEEQEMRRLEEFKKKKKNEGARRIQRITAHRKYCCRQISKRYHSTLKNTTYTLLKDTGFFADKFQTETMEGDVLPWLLEATEDFVEQIEKYEQFPNDMISGYFQKAADIHRQTVDGQHKKHQDGVNAAADAEKAKQEEKIRKRAEREAKRKADELAKLKKTIEETFVEKAVSKDSILEQDLLEIDGTGKRGKGTIGILGGLLGQIMICYHTIVKHFPDLDKRQDEDGYDDNERAVLNPVSVQNFVYNFILDRLAVEKIYMSVGANFESFLLGLEKPLKLNEMRTMKEGNYDKFRSIISDPEQLGDPVLKILMKEKNNMFEKEVFDLIYQGFWDLYTFKPAPGDLSAKKMQQWITRINLSVPDDQIEATDEQEAPEPASLKALVRIRIPLLRPEPEMDEDGNMKEPEKVPESELQEIIPEDKAAVIQPISGEYSVWVIHQHAQRLIRQEIAKEMRRIVPELNNIDLDDFQFKIEKEAVKFEDKFIQLLKPEDSVLHMPVFDFEQN